MIVLNFTENLGGNVADLRALAYNPGSDHPISHGWLTITHECLPDRPCAPIDATGCHRRFVDKSVRRIPATSPGLEHRRLLHRSDTPCPARHPGSSPARRAILKRVPRRSETVCTGCIHCLSIRNELSIPRPVHLAAGAKYSLTLTRRSKHCRSKALRGDLCISCGHPGPKPRSRRAYKRSVTHGRL